jgi:hypothetical protein
MLVTFVIPSGGINALYNGGNSHAVIAPGRFSTSDLVLQKLLANYPNVQTLEATPEQTEVIQPGQFSHVGDPVRVTNGMDWENIKGRKGQR